MRDKAFGLLILSDLGAIHPIIHLGFAVEYQQPVLVAEALAQAAIHAPQGGRCLLEIETKSKAIGASAVQHNIRDLFDKVRADPSITDAECFKGGTYEKNGNFWDVLPQALVDITSSYRIDPLTEDTLDRAVSEMVNACAWLSAGAQRCGKMAKIDFFFMHCINCSIFLSVFAKQSWISLEARARLLEFKVRVDLILYANQGSPKLSTKAISQYRMRRPACTDWTDIIDRAKDIECDGHVVKMIRALKYGSVISHPFEEMNENQSSFPVKGHMWIKIANLCLDSTEDYPDVFDKWLRGSGFEHAWRAVPSVSE